MQAGLTTSCTAPSAAGSCSTAASAHTTSARAWARSLRSANQCSSLARGQWHDGSHLGASSTQRGTCTDPSRAAAVCHPGSLLCTIMTWLHLYHYTHLYTGNLFCKLAAIACGVWASSTAAVTAQRGHSKLNGCLLTAVSVTTKSDPGSCRSHFCWLCEGESAGSVRVVESHRHHVLCRRAAGCNFSNLFIILTSQLLITS